MHASTNDSPAYQELKCPKSSFAKGQWLAVKSGDITERSMKPAYSKSRYTGGAAKDEMN
jgi:hypothetical protein